MQTPSNMAPIRTTMRSMWLLLLVAAGMSGCATLRPLPGAHQPVVQAAIAGLGSAGCRCHDQWGITWCQLRGSGFRVGAVVTMFRATTITPMIAGTIGPAVRCSGVRCFGRPGMAVRGFGPGSTMVHVTMLGHVGLLGLLGLQRYLLGLCPRLLWDGNRQHTA